MLRGGFAWLCARWPAAPSTPVPASHVPGQLLLNGGGSLQTLTDIVFRYPRVRIDALGECAQRLGQRGVRDPPADACERRGILPPQPPELFASEHALGGGGIREVVRPFRLRLRIRHAIENSDEL